MQQISIDEAVQLLWHGRANVPFAAAAAGVPVETVKQSLQAYVATHPTEPWDTHTDSGNP